MIHLMNRVYLDYQFSTIVTNRSQVREIWIGGMADNGHDRLLEDQIYSNLSEVFDQYGDFTTWLRTLASSNVNVVIKATEVDLNNIYVMHLKSIYPEGSDELITQIVTLNAVLNKHVYTLTSDFSINDHNNGFLSLPIPSKEDVLDAINYSNGRTYPYTVAEKRYVSIEYLLANYYSTDKDVDNSYNKELLDRVERLAWKTLVGSFKDTRMNICLGLYKAKEYFGLDVDLSADDIDKEFEEVKHHLLLDKGIDFNDKEFIELHYDEMIDILTRFVGITNDHLSTATLMVLDILTDDHVVDFGELDRLLELDATYPTSQLFGVSEHRYNVNQLLISAIYNNNVRLEEMKL